MKRNFASNSGMMLIEVMLCMTIGMVLLGVMTTVFVRVVVMNPAAHEHLETTITLGRLAEQFRGDVHAALLATSSAADGPAMRLSLQWPGNVRIEYELVEGGIRRAMIEGDQVRQREQFVMSGMKVVGWDIGASKRDVSLVVGRVSRRDADDSPAVRYPFPITARLDRDRRFALVEAPE
ncbi:MAG TPA: hypothetical protein VGZ26_02600 [Pirellulales bacterium]|jgi:hypothetical protein|nr:hypothetical protein [Pirellulales bacterium]